LGSHPLRLQLSSRPRSGLDVDICEEHDVAAASKTCSDGEPNTPGAPSDEGARSWVGCVWVGHEPVGLLAQLHAGNPSVGPMMSVYKPSSVPLDM
jgi:hypothetical protein